MKQIILKFGQNLLALALFSLIALGIMGGLDFTGTANMAVILAATSLVIGSIVLWVSTKTYLKAFNIWSIKQNAICAVILFIIYTLSMISSSGGL